MEHSNYVFSESLRSSIPINSSVISNVFDKKTDIEVGDPSNLDGFSILYDLPFIMGTVSMLLYPIFSDTDKGVVVLQVIGF
jgi:hypothetical protein